MSNTTGATTAGTPASLPLDDVDLLSSTEETYLDEQLGTCDLIVEILSQNDITALDWFTSAGGEITMMDPATDFPDVGNEVECQTSDSNDLPPCSPTSSEVELVDLDEEEEEEDEEEDAGYSGSLEPEDSDENILNLDEGVPEPAVIETVTTTSTSNTKVTKVTKVMEDKGTQMSGKSFKCKKCGEVVWDRKSLYAHYSATHTDKRKYPCTMCDKAFATHSHLRQHNFRHQNPTDPNKYTCQVCDRGFTMKSALARHRVVHSDYKPFQCIECGEKFLHKKSSDRHALMHESQRHKPYQCDLCKRGFAKKESLTTHMVLNCGRKGYVCPVCKKCFALKPTYDIHVALHVIHNNN